MPPLPLPGFAGGDAYDIAIEGEIQPELRGKLEAASQLVSLRRQEPASRAALRRRIAVDVDGLKSVLRAEGFYGSTVAAETDLEADPISIVLRVFPGHRYTLSAFDIILAADAQPDGMALPAAREFGYFPEMPARGADILAIEQAVLDRFRQTGHPFVAVAERNAVVDHDSKAMTVALRLAPGPAAVFGPLSITGLEKVDERYIRYILEWPEGQPWDERRLDESRRRLADTGLFRRIHLAPAAEVAQNGQLPAGLTVEEAKHRTLAVGLNYSTDEELGAELSWEHRNLLGRQERLLLSAEGSAVRRQASADFRKPNFLARNLTFMANVTARDQETDAYSERAGAGFVGLEKRLAAVWTFGLGVSAEYTQINDDGVESSFAIVGLPVHGGRDTTNDLLDPTGGTRVDLWVTPYYATIEREIQYTVFETEASAYFGLGREKKVVPAIRLRTGTIAGADILDIPITKRFFAGGGGSVRGYEYQMAGPLDVDGHPTGGLSVLEAGLELRWRVTDKIGFVPFVEGGNVYDARTPDFGADLFWAAGLGFRYFTIAGPIRIDVAKPLNGRDAIDDEYQIYVSLGQAF